jgi:hypothetical protein
VALRDFTQKRESAVERTAIAAAGDDERGSDAGRMGDANPEAIEIERGRRGRQRHDRANAIQPADIDRSTTCRRRDCDLSSRHGADSPRQFAGCVPQDITITCHNDSGRHRHLQGRAERRRQGLVPKPCLPSGFRERVGAGCSHQQKGDEVS